VIIALTKRGGFARSVAKRGVDSVERESVRDESGQIDLVDGDDLEPAACSYGAGRDREHGRWLHAPYSLTKVKDIWYPLPTTSRCCAVSRAT